MAKYNYGKTFKLSRKGHKLNGRKVRYRYTDKKKGTKLLVLAKKTRRSRK